MVKATLIAALDFAKRPGVVPGRFSYRRDGRWHVCSYGPRYSNTHLVTDYDESGLKWLESIEDKGETSE